MGGLSCGRGLGRVMLELGFCHQQRHCSKYWQSAAGAGESNLKAFANVWQIIYRFAMAQGCGASYLVVLRISSGIKGEREDLQSCLFLLQVVGNPRRRL